MKLLPLLLMMSFTTAIAMEPPEIKIDMPVDVQTIEFLETAITTFFSDVDSDIFNLIKPFLKEHATTLATSPVEVKDDLSEMQKLAIQAAKQALAMQKKELEQTKRISSSRLTKKQTAVISSVCSLIATAITAVVVLTVHFTSK